MPSANRKIGKCINYCANLYLIETNNLNNQIMPTVDKPMHKDGDVLVDYEEKVFEDVQAEPGEKALFTFHTVAFEGSIGLVNTLSATRMLRKGFDVSILLYGPGVTLGLWKKVVRFMPVAFPHKLFTVRPRKLLSLVSSRSILLTSLTAH